MGGRIIEERGDHTYKKEGQEPIEYGVFILKEGPHRKKDDKGGRRVEERSSDKGEPHKTK